MVGRVGKQRPALAAHPRHLIVDATVQVAATAVLLQEGVEGGE